MSTRENLSDMERQTLYEICRIVGKIDSPIKNFWRGNTFIDDNSKNFYCRITMVKYRSHWYGTELSEILCISKDVWESIKNGSDFKDYRVENVATCYVLTFSHKGEQLLENI